MLRSLRERGPVVLVPAAWTTVLLAHLAVVEAQTLLIAHAVMVVLQTAFVALSWSDMEDGALRVWRTVILAGIPVTAAGLVGLGGWTPVPEDLLLGVALFGWMLLPAVGFALTETHLADGWDPLPGPVSVYQFGTVLCVVGALVYGVLVVGGVNGTVVPSLLLVGIGQTAGILDAAYRG